MGVLTPSSGCRNVGPMVTCLDKKLNIVANDGCKCPVAPAFRRSLDEE